MSDGNGTGAPEARRMAPGEAAGTRRDHDAYDTPPELALACVKWLREKSGMTWPEHSVCILDPTSGAGPFAKSADVVFPGSKIVAVDIRGECLQHFAGGRITFACANALELPAALISKADLIVTNPPFKLADQLARHFWASMKPGATLAFLLSVTFIGSDDRWDEEPEGLFKLAPLHYMVPIVPRPSFITIDGKDTSPKFEAALFVWTKKAAGTDFMETEIPRDPIRWEKPKKKRTRAPKNGVAT